MIMSTPLVNAQMLEVSVRSTIGMELRLERDVWSVVKGLRQATK